DPATGFIHLGHGTLVVNGNRSLDQLTSNVEFLYYPDTGDLRGSDQFSIRVVDPYGESAEATIHIHVPNYRPVVILLNHSDHLILDGGLSLARPSGSEPVTGTINLQSNAIDLDNDPLTAILVDRPQHGTVVLDPDGHFIYTPDADSGLFGTDSFSF